MKKWILVLLILAPTLSAFAQPAGFNNLYYSYKGEEGVVALRVPGFLMRIAGSIADLDQDEKDLLRSLRSVTVLTIEENHLYPGVNFTDEVSLNPHNESYKLLMEVHDGEEDVIIAAREKRGKIRDLFVIVGGSENVLVHVRGRMDSDLLGSLSKVAGIDELQISAKI